MSRTETTKDATDSDSYSLSGDQIRRHWSEFSPEEVEWIDGRVHRLIHSLVEKYGISPDEAARQVKDVLQHST